MQTELLGATNLENGRDQQWSRCTTTLLVIDIVGSTALVRRLGDQAYATLLADFKAMVRVIAHERSAVEFADTGDGFIHLFADSDRAWAAATQIFLVNDALNASRENTLEIRAALHRGQIVESDQGLAGKAIHEACELGNTAPRGTLWASAPVLDQVQDRCQTSATSVIDLPKSGLHEVMSIPWHDVQAER